MNISVTAVLVVQTSNLLHSARKSLDFSRILGRREFFPDDQAALHFADVRGARVGPWLYARRTIDMLDPFIIIAMELVNRSPVALVGDIARRLTREYGDFSVTAGWGSESQYYRGWTRVEGGGREGYQTVGGRGEFGEGIKVSGEEETYRGWHREAEDKRWTFDQQNTISARWCGAYTKALARFPKASSALDGAVEACRKQRELADVPDTFEVEPVRPQIGAAFNRATGKTVDGLPEEWTGAVFTEGPEKAPFRGCVRPVATAWAQDSLTDDLEIFLYPDGTCELFGVTLCEAMPVLRRLAEAAGLSGDAPLRLRG